MLQDGQRYSSIETRTRLALRLLSLASAEELLRLGICLHDKGALLILFNKRKWQALEAIQMTPFDIVGSIH